MDCSQIDFYWTCVIAAKEVGKIIGTLLLPVVAERSGRRVGLLANNLVVFVGCYLCYISTGYHSMPLIAVGRMLLGMSGVSLDRHLSQVCR